MNLSYETLHNIALFIAVILIFITYIYHINSMKKDRKIRNSFFGKVTDSDFAFKFYAIMILLGINLIFLPSRNESKLFYFFTTLLTIYNSILLVMISYLALTYKDKENEEEYEYFKKKYEWVFAPYLFIIVGGIIYYFVLTDYFFE